MPNTLRQNACSNIVGIAAPRIAIAVNIIRCGVIRRNPYAAERDGRRNRIGLAAPLIAGRIYVNSIGVYAVNGYRVGQIRCSCLRTLAIDGKAGNRRTGPGSSYPSVGTASSGQMYGGPNNDTQMSGNWAVVDRLYAYSDGKYVSSSLGGTYYISQTGSGKTFWNFTTIPV